MKAIIYTLIIILGSNINALGPLFFGTSLVFTFIITLLLLGGVIGSGTLFLTRFGSVKLVLIGMCGLSFFSIDPDDSDLLLSLNLIFTLVKVVLVTLVIESMVATGKISLDNLEEALRYGLGLGAISIIYCWFFNTDFALELEGKEYFVLSRFSGFYLNPNVAGMAMVFGIWLSIKLNKILFALLFSVSLLLTFSFSAFIGLAIIVIGTEKKYVRLGALVLAIGGIPILFSNMDDDSRLDRNKKVYIVRNYVEGSSDLNELTTGRSGLLVEGLENISENIFLGKGFGSFAAKVDDDQSEIAGIHNTVFQLIGELGILSFLILLFLAIPILQVLWAEKVMFLIFLLYSSSGHGMHYSYLFMIFLSLIYLTKKNGIQIAD